MDSQALPLSPASSEGHASSEWLSSANSQNTTYLHEGLDPFEEFDLPASSLERLSHLHVIVGDAFKRGRYIVLRKLGWGSFGTVWLARDQGSKTFVALKILSSEATKQTKEGNGQEMVYVDRMIERQGQDAAPWLRHFGRFLERFDHRTQDDVWHACIVMEPLGWDIYVLRQLAPYTGFPLWTCKSIVRQLVVALAGLHHQMNTVYTDLKPNNILIRPEHIDSIIVADLLDNPTLTKRNRPHYLPKGLIRYWSQPIPPWLGESKHMEQNVRLEVALVDFGHARQAGEICPEETQHHAYRAPEVYLGYPCSGALDIWALACTTFWLVTGQDLFDSFFEFSPEIPLAEKIQPFGTTVPIGMKELSRHWDRYVGEDGLLRYTGETSTLRESIMYAAPDLPNDEVDGWNKFLSRCLQVQPESRPTAADLMKDPWISED